MTDAIQSVINGADINFEKLILHTVENVDLIPTNITLAGIVPVLQNVMCRETVLKRMIDDIKEEYDYVLIDTNPTLGDLQIKPPLHYKDMNDDLCIRLGRQPAKLRNKKNSKQYRR